MNSTTLRSALLWLVPTLAGGALAGSHLTFDDGPSAQSGSAPVEPAGISLHYLEIVTPDVDAACASLEKIHGVRFSVPNPELGQARTAAIRGGGTLGVRAPMRPDESPVIRPYVLVDDCELAAQAAEQTGGTIALPPMTIPDRGQIAIYLQGGIEYGLWKE